MQYSVEAEWEALRVMKKPLSFQERTTSLQEPIRGWPWEGVSRKDIRMLGGLERGKALHSLVKWPLYGDP